MAESVSHVSSGLALGTDIFPKDGTSDSPSSIPDVVGLADSTRLLVPPAVDAEDLVLVLPLLVTDDRGWHPLGSVPAAVIPKLVLQLRTCWRFQTQLDQISRFIPVQNLIYTLFHLRY
jgi:hypothetical protein